MSGLGSMIGGNLLVDFAASAIGGGKTAPAAPTDVQVQATSTSATLTWAPAPTATGYLVALTFPTGPNDRLIQETVSRDPTVTIPNLTPNTTYQFTLYSVSNVGATPAPLALFTTPAKAKAKRHEGRAWGGGGRAEHARRSPIG